jgi:NAD-dependent SIR2 family protein deacetylase
MRILVITGAGVSAESGIPTFRGKGGYWRNLDPVTLATPEGFARDPGLVWEWYRERRQGIRDAEPNAAHEAIAKLAEQSRKFLLVTQNVDDLHARAGIPRDKMVKIHGDIFLTHCSRCDFSDAGRGESPAPHSRKRPEELDRLKRSSLIAAQDVDLPKCAQCGALMRPGVVWFGEQLDLGEIQRVENFLGEGTCDFALVVGTTAAFGYIIDWAVRAAGKRGQLIEVNPEETPLSQFATRLVREPAAIALPRLVNEILAGSL